MALAPGDKLGPYKIVEAIGQGGMGAVYRAHDSRLGRDVAIKVSEQRFGERFEREAKAVAALNHPNICTLHDVGPNYLVMELVEGQTLSDRIKEGAIPVQESLEIAKQIADALEAAHDKGIVHRDLKPGNVILKHDGSVKVLDFGLAKVAQRGSASGSDDPELSPTISLAATQAGVILGTAAYMAPEQAKGKPVDKRADIWAFGVVLYEMVTGKKLFSGEDLTETLAAVVLKDPDLSAAPAEFRPLLKKCLEKDPRKRLRDITGVELLLESGRNHAAVHPRHESGSEGRRWLWPAIAAVSLLIAGIAFWNPGRSATTGAPVSARFTFNPPTSEQTFAGRWSFAVSPDGKSIAFVVLSGNGTTTTSSLWVRDLDAFTARRLERTTNARSPFWSPDSKNIAFFAEGKLKRISPDGGAPIEIADVPGSGFPLINTNVNGTWWQEEGSVSEGFILFGTGAQGMSIQQIPATGGEPTPVTMPESGELHRFPQYLAAGDRFLYSVDGGEEPGLYVQRVGEAERTRLAEVAGKAVLTPPDYLLYLQNDTLLAQRWDWSDLMPQGAPVSIADGVDDGAFSVSNSGVLAYKGSVAIETRFGWSNRQGQRVGADLPLDAGEYGEIHLAPDDRRAVVTRGRMPGNELWLVELGNDTPIASRLATGFFPAWSPDSRRIAYVGQEGANAEPGIYQITIGSGESTLIYPGVGGQLSWSGNDLIVSGNPVSVLPAPPGNIVEPMTDQPREITGVEGGPVRVSPDGKWVAYVSRPVNTWELWMASYPSFTDRRKVADGVGPRWSGDSKELFFVDEQEGLMSVDVRSGPTFEHTAPKFLMNPPEALLNGPSNYDVTRDGQRFLINLSEEMGSQTVPISVVLNWQSDLERE